MGVAFLEDACSVLEGRGILESRLQCLGGCGLFGGCLSYLQCFGEAGGACAEFWRGMVRVQYFICDFLSSVATAAIALLL